MSITLLLRYIKIYWLTSALISYMIGATILRSYTAIDITIPCLIRYFTGHRCLGCGLTTAVTHLLRLDFQSAFEANALVFVVLPALAFLLTRHWLSFYSEQKKLLVD